MDGMGFYTDADGNRGDTNVHFNKPYLIRKWLPHYDWVLWLDMDTLVVDIAKPIEDFIEEIGGQVSRRQRQHQRVLGIRCLCEPRLPSVGKLVAWSVERGVFIFVVTFLDSAGLVWSAFLGSLSR